MAIEEVITYDYEVREDQLGISVRKCTAYVDSDDPNTALSSSFHRYIIEPDDDYSSQPNKIKAICDAVFTDEVKTKWEASELSSHKKITSSRGGDDTDMKLDEDGNPLGPPSG